MSKQTFLISFLLLLLVVPVSAQENNAYINKKQQELNELNQKLKATKAKLQYKKKKKKKVLNVLGGLKRSIRWEQRNLYKTRNRLRYYESKKNQNFQELKDQTERFKTQTEKLSEHIGDLYKSRNNTLFEFLFSEHSYTDILERSRLLETVLKSEAKLVTDLHQQKESLEKRHQSLSQQTQQIAAMKQKIDRKKQRLKRQATRVNQTLTQLQKEIQIFERQQATLTQESNEIASLIQKQAKGKGNYYAVPPYIRPSRGWLSSKFGYRRHPIFKRNILHSGIDLAAPKGHEIRATNNGYILFAGWQKGYGNTTIIDHGWKAGNRYSSVYAHQWRLTVRKGQYVQKGQLIGYVGSTGYSTGPHLHFEIRKNGKPVNPLLYVKL